MSQDDKKRGMREMHRIGDVSLGTYDNDNFYVCKVIVAQSGKTKGKEVRRNMSYHPFLRDALLNMANRVARDEAATLHEYVSTLNRLSECLALAVRGV